MVTHGRHWLPRLVGVQGITFGKHVYLACAESEAPRGLLAHEEQHVRQYARDGLVGFLVRYSFQYIKRRLSGYGHRHAYALIPYEVEARLAELRATYGGRDGSSARGSG